MTDLIAALLERAGPNPTEPMFVTPDEIEAIRKLAEGLDAPAAPSGEESTTSSAFYPLRKELTVEYERQGLKVPPWLTQYIVKRCREFRPV